MSRALNRYYVVLKGFLLYFARRAGEFHCLHYCYDFRQRSLFVDNEAMMLIRTLNIIRIDNIDYHSSAFNPLIMIFLDFIPDDD